MASRNTVRIQNIPVEVEREDVKQRIILSLTTYRISVGRRFSSFVGKSSQESLDTLQSSLASQGHDQVATVSFESPNVKSHILRRQNILDGWHIDDHFRGITVLHSPKDHEADMCAIHGLGANGFDTWTSTSIMWLRDLLPLSTPFDRCRIATFGYNSSLTDRSASAGIRQWAIDFLNQISHIRSSEQERQRPLIIVCHSLGGLVGREVMIRLGNFPDQYHCIRLDQCGILFLATPHSGTREADWNEMLLAIAEQALGIRARDVVANLRAFNDNSVASKESFAALTPIPPSYCLCEGKKTKVLGSYRMVVSQDSASLNGMTAVSIPDANHSGICKFDGRTGGYLTVTDKLKSIRSKLLERLAGSEGDANKFEAPPRSQGAHSDVPDNAQRAVRAGMQHESQVHHSTSHFGAVTASGQSKVSQIGTVNTSNFSM